MSKKKPKTTVSEEKPGVKPAPKIIKQDPLKVPDSLLRNTCILLAIVAFLLYSNTTNHLFVLDDFSIIPENSMTKRGTEALGDIFTNSYRAQFDGDENGSYIYRPLSKAMFAIEWTISPNNPSIHHWVNIFTYMITAVLLFLTLFKYLKTNIVIPFVATLLYLAHPIHTEVVANIKSRDEILSLIFLLLALLAAHRYISGQKILDVALVGVAFFLCMLSKESSITFLAIIPLTVWFLTKADMKKVLTIGGVLAVTTVIYLLIHRSVIGSVGVDNIPVVDNSLMATDNPVEQKATAILIMGKYLLLLFFPHPLSSDYSYNTIPIVTSGANIGFLLALLIHLGMMVYAIMKIREKNILSYCILFYFITMSLASNLITLIGTNMAERLLYVPSLGFTIAAAVLLARLFKTNEHSAYSTLGAMFKQNKNLLMVSGVIALAFGFKTFDRNKDWTTVKYLFDQDIQTVPNSAHMLYYHANMQTNKDSLNKLSPAEKEARQKIALEELNKALSIYEQFPDAHNQVGKIYFELKNYDLASKAYRRALELNDKNSTYQNNYGTCLFSTGQYAEAEKFFLQAIKLNKTYNDALCNLGSVYGTMGEIKLKEGKQAEAKEFFDKAIHYFIETTKVDADYENAYIFLVATYKNLGREPEGAPWQNKLNEVRERKKKKK